MKTKVSPGTLHALDWYNGIAKAGDFLQSYQTQQKGDASEESEACVHRYRVNSLRLCYPIEPCQLLSILFSAFHQQTMTA